ncbi:hypothetical protein Xen7305DRAFT_00003480 [Xenococcus sp. PCC 7305]|nr:hypothetical protein Xen7305DRAFT_00003480 [Xenococcus sp. PCC 7305]
MFFILLYRNQGLIIFLIALILPLLFSTLLLDVLAALPKPVKKFLCFSPCMSLVAISIKLLVDGSISLGFLTLILPLFCISLYGGFAMMDILFAKKKR